MSFLKKIHNLSIHALNRCASANLVSLAVNVLSAVCMFILDHKNGVKAAD